MTGTIKRMTDEWAEPVTVDAMYGDWGLGAGGELAQEKQTRLPASLLTAP